MTWRTCISCHFNTASPGCCTTRWRCRPKFINRQIIYDNAIATVFEQTQVAVGIISREEFAGYLPFASRKFQVGLLAGTKKGEMALTDGFTVQAVMRFGLETKGYW